MIISRIAAQCAVLQYENHQILVARGLTEDATSVAELTLSDFKLREICDRNLFMLRVQEVESRCLTLTSQIEQRTFDVDLISNLVLAAFYTLLQAKLAQVLTKAASCGSDSKSNMKGTSSEVALRRGRAASVALVARRMAHIDQELFSGSCKG